MAPIQTKTGSQGAGTTIEITLDSAPTQNNFLVLIFGGSDTGWTRNITSITQDGVNWSTDGYGLLKNEYVVDGLGHYMTAEIWIGKVTGETPASAVTVTMDAHCANYANAILREYDDELAASFLDQTAGESSHTQRNTQPYSGTTAWTTQNSELWICAFNLFGETVSGIMEGFVGYSVVASSGSVTMVEKDAVEMGNAGCMVDPIVYIGFAACVVALKKAHGVSGLTHQIYLYGEHVVFNPAGTEDEGGYFYVSVNDMANQTFTITPAPGCALTGVYVDGYPVDLVSEYTFNTVMQDHSLEAYAVPTETPETEAFKALRRRFEGFHAGVDFHVTRQAFSLSDPDPDTGWPVAEYTETTEIVIIVPKALQQLLIGLSPMVAFSAVGFTGVAFKPGDRIVNRYGFSWVVEVVQAIKKLDQLQYYRLQLRNALNWESFADPEANQLLNGNFEQSVVGQPTNWNANMVFVGSGGRTGNGLTMNPQGYVSQDVNIPVNMIGYLQVYLLGGYVDPCFPVGDRTGAIEVTATFDDNSTAVATYTNSDTEYALINLKPVLIGKAAKKLTNIQLKNTSVKDIQIDDVGIFLAPPVLPYYDMLRRKLEQNGRATSDVTLRVLTLSNSKDDDGWFLKSYVETVISAIFLHNSGRAEAVKLGLMPLYNLVAFTLSPRPKQGDQLQEAGVYYNVDAVTNHIFGDHLVYRELKLTQLPLEGKVAGNGGD